jgi:hypothetical protein
MKHSPLILLFLIFLGCKQWRTNEVRLQFTKKWVTGEAEVSRDKNGIPVTIHLRLGDAETFGKEFNIREPFALPCQQVRLLYRNTPQSTPEILQPKWSHAGPLWSYEPELCFHVSVECVWRVLIGRERGTLPLDVNGRLVLISGGKVASPGQIAVILARKPETPEDFARAIRGDVDHFVVARSQWFTLGH